MFRKFVIIVTGLLMLTESTISQTKTEPSELRVAFPYMPPQIDSGKVQTAEQYVLLTHFLRPLVSYTITGALTGNLAESWDVSDNFSKYKFKLKKGQKFSNGDEITAEDAAETIRARMKQQYAIHYDFSKISSVSVEDRFTFTIELKKSDPFFIYELDHPEFRPLHKSDVIRFPEPPAYSIVSGPYVLKSRNTNIFELEKNRFFGEPFEGPEKVKVYYLHKNFDPNLDTDSFLKENFDLIWLPRVVDVDVLIKSGYKVNKPRLGFTYFASLNPDNLDVANRRYIQKILDPDLFTFKDTLRRSRAYQLYLPNGPGRINDSFVKNLWSDVRKYSPPKNRPKNLRILIPGIFETRATIESLLKDAGYNSIFAEYHSYEEYATQIRSKSFDIVFANNDFSSIDLRGNLSVTFNEERPLVLLGTKKSNTRKLVNELLVETDHEKRNAKINALGVELIRNGYIVPHFYSELLVLSKQNIDLSAWSQIVPEIGIWKVKNLKE